jgi:hypothetical protein
VARTDEGISRVFAEAFGWIDAAAAAGGGATEIRGAQGSHLHPLGSLLTHLHAVYMASSEVPSYPLGPPG